MKEKTFLEIIPLIKLPKSFRAFDYSVSESMARQISVGDMVTIPFRKKNIYGIVAKIKNQAATAKKILDIAGIYQKNFLFPYQMELGFWMSEHYYQSASIIFKSIVPNFPKKITPENYLFQEYEPKKEKINAIFVGRTDAKYISEQITKILKEKKQILVLVPEISALKIKLLWLKKNFPEQKIIPWFGATGKKDSLRIWNDIKNKNIDMVVGTRKSVFLPFIHLGLIIIFHEEHPSYKQWDQNPRYHARDVAQKLAELTCANLIIQSFAPKVATYAKIFQNFQLKEEQKKIHDRQIVDMRDEIKGKNFSGYSEFLLDTLKKPNEQAIVLVHTTGIASSVLCLDCGHIPCCQNCEKPLLYSESELLCATCKNIYEMPDSCPLCRGHNFKFIGKGSQKVKQELKKFFPQKSIERFDRETSKKSSLEIIQSFLNNKIDILVATIGIFEELSEDVAVNCIAILSADALLSVPDYQSAEKLFNIILRAETIAKLSIIQTYHPEHRIFRYLQPNNFRHFYLDELTLRKNFSYPPYSRFIKIIVQKKTQEEAIQKSERIYNILKKSPQSNEIEIVGPLIPYQRYVRGKFRRNILIKIKTKTANPENLIKLLPDDVLIDVDPLALL